MHLNNFAAVIFGSKLSISPYQAISSKGNDAIFEGPSEILGFLKNKNKKLEETEPSRHS